MQTELAESIGRLRSGDLQQRIQAAETLCGLGEEASPAAVALVNTLDDPDEELREAAIAALEGMGPPPRESVDDLAANLTSENSDIAYWSATLLGRLESDAGAAVPQLSQLLANENREPAVRQRAAWALGKIGSDATAALESLQIAARSEDVRLARLAQSAINSISDH